jgi:formylmethanofuran dehydrogenase subunit B
VTSPAAIEHQDIACPFCSLLCDDLTIEAKSGVLTPTANACAKATLAYRASVPTAQALIDGKPVSLDAALARAAKQLKHSKRPLIAGLGTDVAGVRAALALAERCRGTVDHMHSAALHANLSVLQARGWQTTTLGEVRNRADLVVLVGVDLNVNYQNLIRRYLAPTAALQPARRSSRRVIYLGPKKSQPVCSELPCDVIATAPASLTETMRLLQALIQGRRVTAPDRGGQLAALAAAIKQAAYPVFIWAPGQLDPTSADLTIAAICDLVAELNLTQRAAALSLGGDDGGQSALAACSWLTGFPLGVSFAGDQLDYAPRSYRASTVIADGQADFVLWINAFSRQTSPAHDLPQIVLAPPGYVGRHDDTTFIPIGTPGLDHTGQLIRTDGVVSLPLRSLRDFGLPSAAMVLGQLSAAMD